MLGKPMHAIVGNRGRAMAAAALLLLAAGCTVLAQTGGLDSNRTGQPGGVSPSGGDLSLFAQKNCAALAGLWPPAQSKTQPVSVPRWLKAPRSTR